MTYGPNLAGLLIETLVVYATIAWGITVVFYYGTSERDNKLSPKEAAVVAGLMLYAGSLYAMRIGPDELAVAALIVGGFALGGFITFELRMTNPPRT